MDSVANDTSRQIDPATLRAEVEQLVTEHFDAWDEQRCERVEELEREGEYEEAARLTRSREADEQAAWKAADEHAYRVASERHGLSTDAIERVAKNERAATVEGEVATAEGRAPLTLDDVTTGGTPFAIDGADAPQRDWLVPPADGRTGLAARRYIVAVSGDSGSAKSIARVALMAAGLRGGTFLGRPVYARRFMLLQGEQDDATERELWKAMGITDADAASIHYTGRELCAKLRHDPTMWAEYVRREAREFRPDVIDIDTIARATPVPLLDNDAVNELYANALVPLADELGCTILIRAHESQDGSARKGGSRASAMLGARAWFDQADGLLTHVNTAKPRTAADGSTRTGFELRVEKMRGQTPDASPEPFSVTGRRSGGGLERLALVTGDDADDADLERIVAAAPCSITQAAAAIGAKPDHDRFKRLLKSAKDEALVVERPDSEDGRKRVLAKP